MFIVVKTFIELHRFPPIGFVSLCVCAFHIFASLHFQIIEYFFFNIALTEWMVFVKVVFELFELIHLQYFLSFHYSEFLWLSKTGGHGAVRLRRRNCHILWTWYAGGQAEKFLIDMENDWLGMISMPTFVIGVFLIFMILWWWSKATRPGPYVITKTWDSLNDAMTNCCDARTGIDQLSVCSSLLVFCTHCSLQSLNKLRQSLCRTGATQTCKWKGIR